MKISHYPLLTTRLEFYFTKETEEILVTEEAFIIIKCHHRNNQHLRLLMFVYLVVKYLLCLLFVWVIVIIAGFTVIQPFYVLVCCQIRGVSAELPVPGSLVP